MRPQREAVESATLLNNPDDPDEFGDEPPSVVAGEPPAPLPRVRRKGAPAPIGERPRAPRRYDDGDRAGEARRLPTIYGRRGPLDFWYIPAAIIVAAVVAIGVILIVGHFTSGGSNTPAAGVSPTARITASVSATASARASATASATPAANATPAPAASTGPPGSLLTVGQKAVVANTGDCLNVRTGPATANPAIVCLRDGSSVTVTGGPQEGEGYTWWKVNTADGEGWAAGAYLAPQ